MSQKESRRAFLAGGAVVATSVFVGAIGCSPKDKDADKGEGDGVTDEMQEEMQKSMKQGKG